MVFVQKTGQSETEVMLRPAGFTELFQSPLALSAGQVTFRPLGRLPNKVDQLLYCVFDMFRTSESLQAWTVTNFLQCTYTAYGAFSLIKV